MMEEEKIVDESVWNESEDISEKLVLLGEVDVKDFMLYLSFDDYWIYVFDFVLGEVKWKYGIVDEGGLKCEFNFDGIVVYCGIDDKLFWVFSVVNGNFIWKFLIEGVVIFLI